MGEKINWAGVCHSIIDESISEVMDNVSGDVYIQIDSVLRHFKGTDWLWSLGREINEIL